MIMKLQTSGLLIMVFFFISFRQDYYEGYRISFRKKVVKTRNLSAKMTIQSTLGNVKFVLPDLLDFSEKLGFVNVILDRFKWTPFSKFA